MEKETHELEEKNAVLQRRQAEDSHSTTLQPDEKGERGDEAQAKSQGGREEEKKNHDIVDQRPQRRKASKMVDKKLKEIIKKLEQRCDLLSVAAQYQHKGSTSKAGDLFQKTVSPSTDRVASFRLPEKFKVPDIKNYTGQEDSVEHLDNYCAHLELQGTPDEGCAWPSR
jgi:hypothetical protein